MKDSVVLKAILIVSGLIALAVGFGLLFVPHAFHASAGILLSDDVNLLNEMRAPGGFVVAAGVFVILGAYRPELTYAATILAGLTYLSFGLSRIVSLAVDGMPSTALLQIMTLELVIGGVCLVALRTFRKPV